MSSVTASPEPGLPPPLLIRAVTVAALSLLGGIVAGFVLALVEIATGVAPFRFSVAAVIPIGAIGCGLVAAVGLYAASRSFHVRSIGFGVGLPLLTAISTFLAAHWFTFGRAERSSGETLAQAMALDGRGFLGSLHAMVTTSSVVLESSGGPAEAARLGWWGYGVVMIEIVGFALGGWFATAALRRSPWCELSMRFMRQVGKHTEYFEDPNQFERSANHLVDVLEMGGPISAFKHAEVPTPARRQRRLGRYRLTVTLFECSACERRHTVIATQHRVNNNWVQLSQTPLQPDAADQRRTKHPIF